MHQWYEVHTQAEEAQTQFHVWHLQGSDGVNGFSEGSLDREQHLQQKCRNFRRVESDLFKLKSMYHDV